MMIMRLCKTSLVAAIALFFTLVAFGNLTDYDSNWQFVQHVLSMDTTFPTSNLHWRAITNPAAQQVAYGLIIATEAVVALLLWAGVLQLLAAVRKPNFARAKTLPAIGLTIGLLLYMVGFIAIGGEWFAMWQSQVWNGQQKAFEFVAMIGAVLVILLLPDSDARPDT
jgi:predicted small integral membrane protein